MSYTRAQLEAFVHADLMGRAPKEFMDRGVTYAPEKIATRWVKSDPIKNNLDKDEWKEAYKKALSQLINRVVETRMDLASMNWISNPAHIYNDEITLVAELA